MPRIYQYSALLSCIFTILSLLIVGCSQSVLRPEASLVQQVQSEGYSDRDWAITLRDHVRYGLVDYDTLRLTPETLMRYCALISIKGPASTPDQFVGRSQITAYYINAYNALVLRAVLSQPADLPTMYDLSLPRLESEYHFAFDGRIVTLAEIERLMLEVSGGDARTILATSRAAMGTPRLTNEPVRPETLDRQLATAAADALDLPEIMQVDHGTQFVLLWQAILDHEDQFIEYWKNVRRVRTFYLWNALHVMCSPSQQRALQSAVGYRFRPVAFDRSLNRWERKADRSLIP